MKKKAINAKAVSGGKRRGRLRIVDVRFTPLPDSARRLATIYDLLFSPVTGESRTIDDSTQTSEQQ